VDDTLGTLRSMITEKFELDGAAIDADAAMLSAGIDSLALAEFLFDVEDRFSIDLPSGRDDVATLRGLAALVDELRAAPRGAAAGSSTSPA